MNPRLAFATALTSVFFWSGCSGVDDPIAAPSPEPAPPTPLPAELQPVAGSTNPGPPKPSLSRLTDKNRPKLEFFGATIYADSISADGAKGNVFVDGTELHRAQRSFPIAVYADEVRLDLVKGEAILSGWPIVQTDSAFVQGQSASTVIQLSQNQVSAVNGPAKYVLGDKGSELFLP